MISQETISNFSAHKISDLLTKSWHPKNRAISRTIGDLSTQFATMEKTQTATDCQSKFLLCYNNADLKQTLFADLVGLINSPYPLCCSPHKAKFICGLESTFKC